MNSRRAAMMVELLLILSASTVALTLTGVLLQRVMRIQMQSRALVDVERTSLRLANQFRRDVHRARSATPSNAGQDEKAFLRLEFEGGRGVEYSRTGDIVLRLESGGDSQTWREEFKFPASNELTIEEQDAPQRLILTIAAKSPQVPSHDTKPLVRTQTVPMSLHVEAVVGRASRLQIGATRQEASE